MGLIDIVSGLMGGGKKEDEAPTPIPEAAAPAQAPAMQMPQHELTAQGQMPGAQPMIPGTGASAGYFSPHAGMPVATANSASVPTHPGLAAQLGQAMQTIPDGMDKADPMAQANSAVLGGGVTMAQQPQMYSGLAQAYRR
jgi:hypothetical protein